jgi:hypothetical protein
MKASGVISSNMLWLYGGSKNNGFISCLNFTELSLGALYQLWQFDIAAEIWTLISGTNTDIDIGSYYGVLGQGTEDTHPSSRAHSSIWLDGNESIWVYGGYYVIGKCLVRLLFFVCEQFSNFFRIFVGYVALQHDITYMDMDGWFKQSISGLCQLQYDFSSNSD